MFSGSLKIKQVDVLVVWGKLEKMMQKTMVSIGLLFAFCLAACYATGYGFGYLAVMRDVVIGTLGTLLLLGVLALYSKKLLKIIFAFYAITTFLYFPVGWLYGSPTFKVVGSFLETNPTEAVEFLSTIPHYVWGLQVVYGILGYLAWRYGLSILFKLDKLQRKYRYYALILSAILLFVPVLGTYLSGGQLQDDESSFPVVLVGFYVDSIVAPSIYWEKKNQLLQQASQPATWKIQSVHPKYKNYVVVIGESARSDYMNVYGFPLENTPFLSKTNGLIIDGYLSAAEFTMASLPKTLSLKNESHNNIVSLAKKAGFATSWLSNQGMLGFFSNEISSYAARSDYTFFTQRGDYQKSLSMSDTMLLPQLDKVLRQPTDKPRLIVLHLMGSHNDFCKRLDNGKLFDYKGEKLSCYVSSIKQTDDLLRDIVARLQQQNESYSLIYFSDHGLKHEAQGNNERTLIHGGDTYESFTVPLVKLSSDDTQRQLIKTQRSAFNFLKGFSQWTGIQTQQLDTKDYDFFGEQPDKAEITNNLAQVNALKHDPIVP